MIITPIAAGPWSGETSLPAKRIFRLSKHTQGTACPRPPAARSCPDCCGDVAADTYRHSAGCPLAASADRLREADLLWLAEHPEHDRRERPLRRADLDMIEVTTGRRVPRAERAQWRATVGPWGPRGVVRAYWCGGHAVAVVIDVDWRAAS